MKIQNRKNTKKLTPAVAVISLLLLAGILALLFYLNRNPTQGPSSTDETENVSHVSDTSQAQDLKENPDNKQNVTNSDKPPALTNDTNTGKQQVQMASSYNISEGTVYIRGGINYPVGDGSCYAVLSGPSGQSIRKDTTLLQNPASTDCKTIAIPTGELSSGKWMFTLHFTSDSYSGVADEVSFSL